MKESGSLVIREKARKNPRQTMLSIVILCTLTVIGVGILITQFRYNPAVLKKEAFLPEPGESQAPPRLSASKFFQPLPEGVTPLTPAETFDPLNLSDKINGKAELYLSAGFKKLVSQRFKDIGKAGLWMEAFVYDMGNSQNAFSVFSTQRRQDAETLDLTQNAYQTSNALFLTHGPFYVEIIASKKFSELPKPIKGMAETFVQNTAIETVKKARNEPSLFPKQGQIKNSISLIATNAFGFDGFNKIYSAEYRTNGHTLMAYLSRCGTPQKAGELVSAYADFLLSFGGKGIESKLPIRGARIVEVMDTFEIIFSRGPYLAGVREATTLDQAERLASDLFEGLKE